MAHQYTGKFLLVSILCSVGYTSTGQSSAYSTDTAYVGNSLRAGEAIESSDAKKALGYYQKAYTVARRVNYARGYFEAVRLLAFALNNVGRSDEAKSIAQQALQQANTDTSKRYKMISHGALAITAARQGDLAEAIRQYAHMAEYVRALGRRDNEAVIYNNMAAIYQRQDLLDQAIAYNQKALAIRRTLPNNDRDIASSLFNIGAVYGVRNNYRQEANYTLQALRLLKPERDVDMVIRVYNNLGYVYRSTNKYDSSFFYLNKALVLSHKMGASSEEIRVLSNLAANHLDKKNANAARPFLVRARAIMDTLKPGLSEQQSWLAQMVDLSVLSGDYKSAYQWLEQYTNNKDSLANLSIREQLETYDQTMRRAEAREKIAEKQAQIARLEADQRRQTMWLWLAGMAVLALTAGGGLGWLYYRQRQKTAAAALLAAQQEQELTAIKSELAGQQKERTRISKEMHDDLGASMTAIGLLSEVAKTRVDALAVPEVGKISEISAAMVTSMNEIIWSLNTRNDSLNGLIAYIRAYAREFIDNTPLTLKIDIQESPDEVIIRGVDRRNMFLTVKEALNNVVKHAQAIEVTLRMRPQTNPTQGGTFHIDICDNGRGFDPASLAHIHRNGLTNMSLRMQESGGTCNIESTQAGTCVLVRFPY
ncbi:tetratricopeptide repeat protein [Fibrella sp. HMF5335]|uniref:Tetratricopeptide repeat protein n=1 Tax=Fibrella rubiginis TaxID=2817060 RepID=A0A939K822_9BACT|nr:tetratricopeptide repeat protein [Fibrella rubiginis]MBO0940031.1 tetratricopeptide repeat protein [Fibrella rubiginis]